MDLQFMQLGQVQVKVESTMEKIDREMQKKKPFHYTRIGFFKETQIYISPFLQKISDFYINQYSTISYIILP